MQPLLYLVHRIPYPPNKGDKIRSYNLLRSLSKKYNVYLGTFIDNSIDVQYVGNVEKYCAEVCVERLSPNISKVKSLSALVGTKPMSLPYYYNKRISLWVRSVIRQHNIKRIVVFSSSMAQYVEHEISNDILRVIDFVDIDSDKWTQYAKNIRWPLSWIYNREAKTLFQYEKRISKVFNKSYFVSKLESDLFEKLTDDTSGQIDYFNNGVDSKYFDVNVELINPFEAQEVTLVFTGAMDYWANVDAVIWFEKNVLPLIALKIERVKFYIVGAFPGDKVRRLESNPMIRVTGKVKDMRPYIKYADVIVAPLRIARGVQNKVLEAMAFNKAIVATQAAVDGIEDCELFAPDIADDAEEMADMCVKQLNNSQLAGSNIQSRTCILSNYNWEANLSKVMNDLEGYT